MPDRISKLERLVQESTREYPERDEPDDVAAPEPEKPEKNPHAQALGRLGGLKGGKARAAKLSPEQRREIARRAAEARWGTRS